MSALYGRASMPAALQPAGDPLRVRDREAVDDPGARHARQVLCQPGEALCLVAQRDRVEVQRVPCERPADQGHVVAQLLRHVLNDAVVRGCRRAQHGDGGAQQRQQPPDATVVRDELVAPVADAVRLVHDEHADGALDRGQEPRVKSSLANRCADTNRTSIRSAARSCSIASQSSRLAELMVTARRPSRSAASIWFRMS